MTDGETGDRGYWIGFQINKLLTMPEFESVEVGKAYETTPLASMAAAIEPEDLPDVAVSYEAALFADLDRALETLDHDR